MSDEYLKQMADLVIEIYAKLVEQEKIEGEVESLRTRVRETMSKFNRDSFDHPDSPLTITNKLVSTGERMKKGGKQILKNILSPDEWTQVYEPSEKKVQLRVLRKDKKHEYDGVE